MNNKTDDNGIITNTQVVENSDGHDPNDYAVDFIEDHTHSETSSDKDSTDNIDSEDAAETKSPNKVVKYTAIVTDEWSMPKTDFDKFSYTFSLPSIGLLKFSDKVKDLKNLSIDTTGEDVKTWTKVNEESVEYFTPGGLYQYRFTDENSEFSQGVRTKEGDLKTISQLKFKQTEGDLSGELAILKVSKVLGLGDVLSVPLPHSGIWVTIKPPTEKDLIDFYNNIFKEKIAIGRSSFGLTLTNFSSYINRQLFDFIIKHVHSINYQDINKSDLDKYILIHDFHILAWGFASTMYPNGFDYQRACLEDPEKCTYVAKAVINMCKLLWVDNPSLSEAQKIIMSESRPNKLTLDNYRKYIAEHVRVSGSEFTLKEGIKIKLKIPTFAEYTSDGLSWINTINSAIDSFIVEEGDEAEAKTQLLDQYVRSSILCQFNHFIDYIEVENNVISDRNSIKNVLEVFSASDELREEITNNIIDFKSKTTIGLIGIPDYKCPSCNKNQNPDVQNDKFTNVIPLDTMNLFFTLVTLRISKIMERQV